MTGTSCDGADLALLELTRGRSGWTERLARTASQSFPPALRARLRKAQRGKMSIRDTALLTRDYSEWIAGLCDRKLRAWKQNRSSCLIAAHGQTVWHEPENRVSVQLLDAAVVVARTGCTVAACFRQPDLAHGGEGAPLVPYYHWLRATTTHARLLPFAVHNVGGIANLTYVSAERDEVIAFDTGPGNALIDLATERATRGAQTFDRAGRLGASAASSIDWAAIRRLCARGYYAKRPPKSTGRELFNEAYLKKIPGHGTTRIANATALTAYSMAKAYANFVLKGPRKVNAVFIAGGGARNPFLLSLFERELARLAGRSIPVAALPPDFAPSQFIEAMAFARLGFEALGGRPVSLRSVTGSRADALGAGLFPGPNYARLSKLVNDIG